MTRPRVILAALFAAVIVILVISFRPRGPAPAPVHPPAPSPADVPLARLDRITLPAPIDSPVNDAMQLAPAARDAWPSETHAAAVKRRLDLLGKRLGRLVEAGDAAADFDDLLAPDFRATPLWPDNPARAYDRLGMVVERAASTDTASQSGSEFATALRRLLGPAAALERLDWSVASITLEGPPDEPVALDTDVQFNWIGRTADRRRLEWLGWWQLRWTRHDAGEWRIARLAQRDTLRGQADRPLFVDVTEHAVGALASYRDQLLPGLDHWRERIDAACGIDVYGHCGAALGDIDNDGDDDLFICQPAGLPSLLYRNRGDGTFEDVTAAAGFDLLDEISQALFFDMDNDADQDLLLVAPGAVLFFANDGSGRFSPSATDDVLHTERATAISASIADYDNDGLLDVYVCSYVFWQGAAGKLDSPFPFPYHDAVNGAPNVLLRNQGNGRFVDVTRQAGLDRDNHRFSLASGWADYDRDGDQDLYVANDFGRNNLYRNDGDGTFTDVAAAAGVEDLGPGMSVCWRDLDNDGHDDLYVGNLWSLAGNRIAAQPRFRSGDDDDDLRAAYRRHARGNSLFRNRGDGTFEDITRRTGTGLAHWAWSSVAFDADNDGLDDLYVANGFITNRSNDDL